MPILIPFFFIAGAFAAHAHREALRREWEHHRHADEERRHKELLEAIEASKVK
jgi:hypothetical protein